MFCVGNKMRARITKTMFFVSPLQVLANKHIFPMMLVFYKLGQLVLLPCYKYDTSLILIGKFLCQLNIFS